MKSIAWAIVAAAALLASASHGWRGATGAAIADQLLMILCVWRLYREPPNPDIAGPHGSGG